MKNETILSKVDHTLLKQESTWAQIKETLDEAMEYHAASACIPPAYVKQAKEYVGDRLKICTVIGFPNGYNTTAVKCFETEDAIKNGADEIDMVINLGWVKDAKYDELLEEIKSIKNSCKGKLLKVIIETCLLTEKEKIKLCDIINESGANFIKTSTGFSTEGATKEDIFLFSKHIAEHVSIKAAGGISNIDDAIEFISLGADRLGTSRVIKTLKNRKFATDY